MVINMAFCHRTLQHINFLNAVDWNKSADEGKPTDVVYMDFSKTCDSILYDKFAPKLKSYNFCDNTVKWLLDFLTIRT